MKPGPESPIKVSTGVPFELPSYKPRADALLGTDRNTDVLELHPLIISGFKGIQEGSLSVGRFVLDKEKLTEVATDDQPHCEPLGPVPLGLTLREGQLYITTESLPRFVVMELTITTKEAAERHRLLMACNGPEDAEPQIYQAAEHFEYVRRPARRRKANFVPETRFYDIWVSYGEHARPSTPILLCPGTDRIGSRRYDPLRSRASWILINTGNPTDPEAIEEAYQRLREFHEIKMWRAPQPVSKTQR